MSKVHFSKKKFDRFAVRTRFAFCSATAPLLAKLAFFLLTGKDGRQTGKLGQNDAKANDVVAVAGVEVVPARHTTVGAVAEPATATKHAVRA